MAELITRPKPTGVRVVTIQLHEDGEITIRYIPGDSCLDIQSLQRVLEAAEPREPEEYASWIADQIQEALKPQSLWVTVRRNTKGIETKVESWSKLIS